MSRQLPHLGEVIGLAVMLLMVVAVVAAQADASVRGSEALGERSPVALIVDPTDIEPAARLRAVIDLDVLAIAIDASATVAPRGARAPGN